METYKCTTTFDSFVFSADFGDAASPICVSADPEEYDMTSTPFQVADARHEPWEAAILLIKYFGKQYWLSPMTKIEDGLYDGLTDRQYIEHLIRTVTEI
jgi:hypothetical protein